MRKTSQCKLHSLRVNSGMLYGNLHCDVLNITTVRVASFVLDCNGIFAIKAYSFRSWSCATSTSPLIKVLSRVYTPYAVRTQPKCANESTQKRAYGRLHSTRRSRRVCADIYEISVAYHFMEMDLFYMSRLKPA